jgi:hypothetical protein
VGPGQTQAQDPLNRFCHKYRTHTRAGLVNALPDLPENRHRLPTRQRQLFFARVTKRSPPRETFLRTRTNTSENAGGIVMLTRYAKLCLPLNTDEAVREGFEPSVPFWGTAL